MKVLGAGDNVVDRYRHLGMLFPGGNALNVAVFATRLGAQASYMGVVGSDDSGRHVLDSLRQEGVDTALTRTAHGHNAYADVDLVDTDRVFLGSNRGVALFDPDEEQLEAMAGFDVVHTGYAGSLRPYLAQMAAHTKVSFDFGSRYELSALGPELPHLYLASFSASHLSPEQTTQMLDSVLDTGATFALATRGSEGAVLASRDGLVFQEADRVGVVDTLGAGDAFIASVLVGLLAHRDLHATMASAAAHAAQVCLQHGAFGHGVPYTVADGGVTVLNERRPNSKVMNS